MEFALSEKNIRIKATHGTIGFCELCHEALIPKCGSVKIHHWAHKSLKNCDPWWEGETNWHREWKSVVPENFREIVVEKDGKKHRADILLQSGIIVEFQKSPLSLDERFEREIFYQKILWVIYFPKKKVDSIFKTEREDNRIIVDSFSEGFFSSPHTCPVFLDFNDGEIFWISEFGPDNGKRKRSLFGEIILKEDFVNNCLKGISLNYKRWMLSNSRQNEKAEQKQREEEERKERSRKYQEMQRTGYNRFI
jgi:hypothetical protein